MIENHDFSTRMEQLRQHLAAVERERAELLALISAAPSGIALLDRKQNIVFANETFAGATVDSAADLAGRSLPEALPDLGPALAPACGEALEGRPVLNAEIRTADGCGERVWLASCYPLSLSGDAGIGVILRDVTNVSALHDRLCEAHQSELVGRLAGGIAHRFNNLLAGIIGGMTLALDSLPDTSAVRPPLQVALSSSEQAAELVRELLSYAGKGRFVVLPVDVTAIAIGCCERIARTVPGRITITTDMAEDLPPVEADPDQMEQLLMCLLRNAIEAIGDDAGEVRIATGVENLPQAQKLGDVRSLDLGAYVRIEVSDTGCGMDEQVRKRMFDPFFTTKFTGRGLGLAAVQGIVTNQGGAVFVETAPGKGSTFRVLLPAPGKGSVSRSCP